MAGEGVSNSTPLTLRGATEAHRTYHEQLRRQQQPSPPPYILRFGQHRGSTLDECPKEYLNWLVSHRALFDRSAYDDFQAALDRYLARRKRQRSRRLPSPPPPHGRRTPATPSPAYPLHRRPLDSSYSVRPPPRVHGPVTPGPVYPPPRPHGAATPVTSGPAYPPRWAVDQSNKLPTPPAPTPPAPTAPAPTPPPTSSASPRAPIVSATPLEATTSAPSRSRSWLGAWWKSSSEASPKPPPPPLPKRKGSFHSPPPKRQRQHTPDIVICQQQIGTGQVTHAQLQAAMGDMGDFMEQIALNTAKQFRQDLGKIHTAMDARQAKRHDLLSAKVDKLSDAVPEVEAVRKEHQQELLAATTSEEDKARHKRDTQEWKQKVTDLEGKLLGQRDAHIEESNKRNSEHHNALSTQASELSRKHQQRETLGLGLVSHVREAAAATQQREKRQHQQQANLHDTTINEAWKTIARLESDKRITIAELNATRERHCAEKSQMLGLVDVAHRAFDASRRYKQRPPFVPRSQDGPMNPYELRIPPPKDWLQDTAFLKSQTEVTRLETRNRSLEQRHASLTQENPHSEHGRILYEVGEDTDALLNPSSASGKEIMSLRTSSANFHHLTFNNHPLAEQTRGYLEGDPVDIQEALHQVEAIKQSTMDVIGHRPEQDEESTGTVEHDQDEVALDEHVMPGTFI